MRRLLITIADFPDFVPFSVNISPLLVNPHIRDAQTFDVGPLLRTATWDALEAALDAVVPEFAPQEFDSAEFLTSAATMGWTDAALARLWYAGVRPLLVCEAARRMLLGHGFHVTPNGVETISDIGHQPISSAQRSELRADYQARCSHYRNLLAAALRAYAPASTPCASAARPGAGGLSIYAL